MGQSVTWLRSELASAELTAGSRVLKTFSSLDNSMSLCSLLALTVFDESEEMNTCVFGKPSLDQMLHTHLGLRLCILPSIGCVLVPKRWPQQSFGFYGISLLFADRLLV